MIDTNVHHNVCISNDYTRVTLTIFEYAIIKIESEEKQYECWYVCDDYTEAYAKLAFTNTSITLIIQQKQPAHQRAFKTRIRLAGHSVISIDLIRSVIHLSAEYI